MNGDDFTFPKDVDLEQAQELLREAYASIPEGKLLRKTLKEQRVAGLDPPLDVQYVAEPRVVQYGDGIGVELNADILVYDDFPEAEDCLTVFEQVLSEALVERLEKALRAMR